jgi:hypothetical protein
MAQSYKTLGQIYPTANVLSNIYVTAAANSAVINSIYICNQSINDANVEIIIREIDDALENKHYILFDENIGAASTYVLNLGITMGSNTILAANTKYRVGQLATSNISYNAFGLEIT